MCSIALTVMVLLTLGVACFAALRLSFSDPGWISEVAMGSTVKYIIQEAAKKTKRKENY